MARVPEPGTLPRVVITWLAWEGVRFPRAEDRASMMSDVGLSNWPVLSELTYSSRAFWSKSATFKPGVICPGVAFDLGGSDDPDDDGRATSLVASSSDSCTVLLPCGGDRPVDSTKATGLS